MIFSIYAPGLGTFSRTMRHRTIILPVTSDEVKTGFFDIEETKPQGQTFFSQEGHLRFRYLGLPLISTRLSITDCQSLLQKIDSRIKGIIKEMIKRFRTFLWKGTSSSGYPKVAWETVCRTIEEGGLVKENKGAWGWRKMLSLSTSFDVSYPLSSWEGGSISFWHDPWHPLGLLISRFPRGPQMTSTGILDKLSTVIKGRAVELAFDN
ncbi:hypothetical protein Sango_3087200 [Sesamum angolense]|uniref:Uncharacterized protein n=1 Tax=Sesamum angolense TaxID=2727404 RepID=A0AAE1W173_9LAMI|nr:hypothetical protein Sango_3087200 [Sesamum angolense]